MSVIGQRIKELRKAAKLTQEELAEGIITRSYMSQIEGGAVQPSYDTLIELAQKLNCAVEDFFEEPENRALLLAQWKKSIKHAESQVESGLVEHAEKTLDNLNISSWYKQEPYESGILSWVKGKIDEKNKNWQQAKEHYIESINHFTDKQFIRERIRSMDSLGYVHLRMDEDSEAMKILSEAYDQLIHYQIGGVIKTSLLLNLGTAHGKLGEYPSAIRLLEEADEINRASKTFFKAGHIFMALGICFRRIKLWSKAEQSYQHALSFFDMFDDLENKAGTLTNLGVLYTHTKEYTKAIENLLMAITLYEQQCDQPKIINASLELANAYMLNGQYEEANHHCQSIISQENVNKHHGTAYKILGGMEHKQGSYTKALGYYERSLDIYQRLGFLKEARETMDHIADTYYAQKNYQKAADYYYRANHLDD